MIFALLTACVNASSDTTLFSAYDSLIALPQNRHCGTPYKSVSAQDGHFMVAVIGCDKKISFVCKFLPICEEPSNAALERLAHATTNKPRSPASPLQALVILPVRTHSALYHKPHRSLLAAFVTVFRNSHKLDHTKKCDDA